MGLVEHKYIVGQTVWFMNHNEIRKCRVMFITIIIASKHIEPVYTVLPAIGLGNKIELTAKDMFESKEALVVHLTK